MTSSPFPSRAIGDFTVTAVSDGYLPAGPSLLCAGEPPAAPGLQDDIIRSLDPAGLAEAARIHINCYLVQGGGRTILVDSGVGGFRPGGGCLKHNLPLAGVLPEAIDAILLTHAHPDHVGGLVDSAGAIAFPNAALYVPQRELAFWQDDGQWSRATARASDNFRIARQIFATYRDRLHPFDHGAVLPGITAMPLPGHTAGHTGYRIGSGHGGLVIWGDSVHFPMIQVTRPDVSVVFDQDPQRSAATRLRLLDLVSAERLTVAGMHLDDRGFAGIERANRGYRIHPAG